MSSTSPNPPISADIQHFPAIPSYVVALSVVAAVVVTALVIFILYSCLVHRSLERMVRTVGQSPIRETEQLREETAVEHDDPLSDTAIEVTARHVKPKPSPSIFSRGDFVLEVLGGVESTTDIFIAGDVENTSRICEDDRVTVAMDDLVEDDNHSVAPSSPPRQAVMDLSCTPTMGLRVRGQCEADASTAGLRGSISSGEGESGGEGGEVIICEDIEIYEDPVVGEIYEDPVVGEIYEDPVVGEIYEDPVVGELNEDPVVGELNEDPVVGELNEDPVTFVVEVGVECHEEDINILVDDGDIKECNSSNDNKSTAILGLNMTIGSHEAIPEVNFEDDLVEDVENCPASEFVIKNEESYSNEVYDIEHAKYNEEGEGVPSPTTLSTRISGQDDSCSISPLQASTCLAEPELTPAQTIPLNIIPVSSQKKDPPAPNAMSAQLSHSTPTSLLHPLVSMHALPLTERALSVSHLSLNRSGKHLPSTPLSCNSEYSPVYNMQFGSARRLATEVAVAGMGRKEVDGRGCEEEEVALLSSEDASEEIRS